MPKDKSKAYWPTSPLMADCEPKAVIAIAIQGGAMDAPYSRSPGKKPSAAEIKFWDRVIKERHQIAEWIAGGLEIEGPAKVMETEKMVAAFWRKRTNL